MKRGRRHGRSPHSRARAVAGGSNVGRCPIFVVATTPRPLTQVKELARQSARSRPESSAHRRQRRSRTRARTLLRATLTGWISPNSSLLEKATSVLRHHHSNSVLAMTSQQSPWCYPCHKWLKKGSAFCLKCGTPADTLAENYQSADVQTPWRATAAWVNPESWNQTKAWRQRSPSPRTRDKGKGKGTPKPPRPPKGGKGKPVVEDAPQAPILDGLPAPPAAPRLALPAANLSSTEVPPTEAQQRDTLLGTLWQARETLPPNIARHSSALEGSASGCHATGQGQKRALPGQSGQTKFFLIMGLLYRQNHGFAREAIPGAAAGHRKLCSCRSQMGGAVARGFCYIGSSVRRLTGYTFGLGGDGCLGLKGQGRRRSLANRRGYQRSPTTTHGADTGFTSSSDLTRASSPGKVKDAGSQPQGLRIKGGQDAERGGGSGQRFNGCSAPQVGSRSCLKREYEPDTFVRVQQWTHSIVSWHNFVGPFEAEALGLTQAFCQELIALGLPAHCGLEDGRVESEETDVNAGRSTASDLGIRGEYPQRSSLADMDSTSQFEQDLSVGNLSVPQIRASPSSAMSHEVVDRSERGFGCMYSSRSALRPFGRPRKAHASVSFSPRVSFWFPLHGQSRLCQKDVFLVGPAVADGCLIPPEVALVVPEAGPSYGLPVQRVGFRPPEVVPPVLCTVPLLALPEEHARVRDIGCSHVAKGFGGGCLTDDPSDVIFMDSFIPDPVDGPSAHGSILRDITNGARGDVGVQRHGEFHGPCGRRFESGSQFGPKDLQVGFQSPALTQSDDALVSSHAGSLLSKGGSCRTLSGDPAPNASTVLSSSAAPAGPPFKRPRALSKSKPHSRRYDARAHSRLLACTGAPGTSSEDDAPFGWELGRKKRSTAPNVDTSQPAAQRTSGTQGVQPWAEQPVPAAPAVQVVSGSASSTTNTAPFSVFDYAAGAAVKPRPPGLTAEQCLRRAISDSYVANPIGRLLNTEVPGWPTPQALVFEYRVFRTHIACVVVIAGFFENPFVLQVPLHSTMHRVLALTPVGGDLALVRCQVDNAPIHCDAFLPEDIDYVFFEVTARPVPRGVHLVEQRPFVSVTELPEAALGQASSSSTDVALGSCRLAPQHRQFPMTPGILAPIHSHLRTLDPIGQADCPPLQCSTLCIMFEFWKHTAR